MVRVAELSEETQKHNAGVTKLDPPRLAPGFASVQAQCRARSQVQEMLD